MPGSLADRLLDLAAGCPVDAAAYHRYSLNIPRLTAMGKAYRAGWLHNVLRRITPFTAYSLDDYVAMADLFVTDAFTAQSMLQKMSADLNAFATAAGVNPCASDAADAEHEALRVHCALYGTIGKLLGEKFDLTPPAPFACTVLGRSQQAEMNFVRGFIDTGAPRLPTWLNSDPDY
ncbi:MAG TPA: hypothetical protein VHP58_02405 [Alphaproteobacteria bacterium]|nr:hypothetical protein [Alphaproteobacteria bacterium]